MNKFRRRKDLTPVVSELSRGRSQRGGWEGAELGMIKWDQASQNQRKRMFQGGSLVINADDNTSKI